MTSRNHRFVFLACWLAGAISSSSSQLKGRTNNKNVFRGVGVSAFGVVTPSNAFRRSSSFTGTHSSSRSSAFVTTFQKDDSMICGVKSIYGLQQQKQRQGAWMGWMLAARMSDNNNNGESNNKQAAAVLDEDDSNNDDNDDDFEALFAKYCDSDGLISKESVLQIPSIANLLETGELLPLEFQEIYDRAPKFPSTAESSAAKREDEKEDRIDVDSFVQVFRDVDDLFEPEDKDDNDNINNLTLDTNTFLGNESTNSKSQHDLSTETTSSLEENDAAASLEKDTGSRDVVRSTTAEKEEDLEEDSDDEREFDPSLDGEIGNIFASLCDTDGLIARPQLEEWDEIVKLMTDGLLGRDELDEIWDSALKSSTGVADEKLDLNGFLSFNTALDELFVFDDDDMDDVIVPLDAYTTADDEDADDGVLNNVSGKNGLPTNLPLLMVVSGKELSPDVLFVSLANADGLVGLDELRQWRELNEMIADGDLLESELIDMFQRVKKSEMDLNKVENEGFVELYNAIDSLFEDEDVTDEMKDAPLGMENGRRQVSRKEELLDAIVDLNNPRGVVVDDDKNSDKGVLPCGLESTDLEQLEILSIVELVEGASTNLIRSKQQIAESELSGNWELLYTSSSAMKFNKGLSGLGGSMPNGRFGSLRQKLVATKLLTDVEYVERIEMVPSSASFDVTVTGTWDLRTSVSLFTGEPSLVMNVVPDRVTYGPTSTRADHWKSLGPMNMLDITYLDEDLRIMRGNTSVDTVFVFRRI